MNDLPLTEIELLSLAIRLDKDDEWEVARFKEIINRSLDWNDVGKVLTHHHIAPFFYYNLESLDIAHALPPLFLNQLSSVTKRTEARNIIHFTAAERLARYFQCQEIDFILLKGIALYLTVYRDRPGRYISDSDLLVKESQWKKIKAGLPGLGYEIDIAGNPGKWRLNILSEALKELTYEKNREFGKVTLDMHWGITKGIKPASVSRDKLWNNRVFHSIGGLDFPVLSPENLLIHHCLHLSKNMVLKKSLLVWFCDIIDMVRFYE